MLVIIRIWFVSILYNFLCICHMSDKIKINKQKYNDCHRFAKSMLLDRDVFRSMLLKMFSKRFLMILNHFS